MIKKKLLKMKMKIIMILKLIKKKNRKNKSIKLLNFRID